MLLGVTTSKKIPRILLAQKEDSLLPLPGIQALWPDRSESLILDLSFSGMWISSNPVFASSLKLQQSMEFNLRIKGLEDHVHLKTRLVKIEAQSLGFIFESMTIDGRLVIDQAVKDRITVESMRDLSLTPLPAKLRGDLWLHGAFDTNIILWKGSQPGELQRVLIEYENTICVFEKGEQLLHKSPSAVEETASYFQEQEIFAQTRKVSQGASWLDRLIKVVEKIDEARGDLFPLIQLLKTYREQ